MEITALITALISKYGIFHSHIPGPFTIQMDSFSNSLAPICFAILSDKARERTAALTKLHSILPVAVRQKDFNSETAGKVVKSFLDWLQAEIRIARKAGNSSSSSSSVSTVLKELKWTLSLFDINFPRIDLSEILFELIDRLIDALNFGNFPEIVFILNQQILCKSPYLKLLEASKFTTRFNRLITILHKLSFEAGNEGTVKSLTYLAISLPDSLKLEPITYEMFHLSFLKYLSSTDNCGFLPSLLGAVNSLLLDYFEHSQKYAFEYFPFVLNFLKIKNSPLIFNKCLQFFLLSLDNLSELDRVTLACQLEKELDDPQNCPLYPLDPVTFCYEIVENRPVNFAHFNRQMFLSLCYKLGVKNTGNTGNAGNIPFCLFKILRYNANIEITESSCTQGSSDWNNLLQFHIRKSSINFDSFASSSKLNWYKLWMISRCPFDFPQVKMSELDGFVQRSLKSFTIPLDTLGLEGFAAYYKLRFKDLPWTITAHDTFKYFLDVLNENKNTLVVSPSLLKCLLPCSEINVSAFQEDPKALDCSLFLSRLNHLEARTSALYSAQDKVTVTSQTPSLSIPETFLKLISMLARKDRQNDLYDFIFDLFVGDQNSQPLTFIENNSNLIWLYELLGPWIAKRLPITDLLSFLIPKVEEETSSLADSVDSSVFDDDFKMKSSEFEVNPSFPHLFNSSKVKAKGMYTRLSQVLLHSYDSIASKTEEEIQILNDWKVFMTELTDDNVNSESPLPSSAQELSTLLRECRPYFDLPVIQTSFNAKMILPSPLTIAKKLATPEQWIPFIFILLKSETSTVELILDWLMALPVEFFAHTKLAKLIKMNTSQLIANEFFRKWIESSRDIDAFPFMIFTNESTEEFLLKSPFLSEIITKRSLNITTNTVNKYNPYILASVILEESSAKYQSRKPVDINQCLNLQSQHLNTQFIPLLSVLLSHGQFHHWPVVVSSLQSLAKRFKVSAATDFSELFNPIHSLFILRSLSGVAAEFIKTLFTNVPVLNHYPQLLRFTLKMILEREDLTVYERYNLESTFVEVREKQFNASDISNNLQPSQLSQFSQLSNNTDFVTFVLCYGHSKLFSASATNAKLIELLFDILNLTNVSGSRVFPLESFERSVPLNIRDDLKLLLLPPGSKVLCFNKQLPLKVSDVKFTFAESKDYWKHANPAELLTDLCKHLCSYTDETWGNILLNLLESEGDDMNDTEFLRLVLPFLLDSINKKASYTVIPELIQKLIEGLRSVEIADSTTSNSNSVNSNSVKSNITSSTHSLIIDILHLIIEKTPVGPNVVDTILRRFAFNAKIFKTLQDDSPSRGLYYFSLLRESPKLANSELNLNELEGLLLSETESEYLTIVKKRLSKFDDFDIEWPESKVSLTSEMSKGSSFDNLSTCWLDRKWFDKQDFYHDNLLLTEFIEASTNLSKLHSLLKADHSMEFSEDDRGILKMLKNCCVNRKKLSSANFKEILQVASEVEKLNFMGIGLLPLCSPKLEQVSKHLLADISAKIHWSRGEHEEALEIAKESLKLFPATLLPDEWKALQLARIGEWATASKSERPSHILAQYFERAMYLCENTSNFSPASLAQIHIKIARFLDEQYQQIKESEDFKNRAKLLEESRAALTAARNAPSSQQDRINVSISTLRNQYELDMQEYSERKRSLNSFLTKAVENYISALSFGVTAENDQMAAISRLCALWFSNADFPSINESINNAVNTQPSTRKSLPLKLFLPLIYQLAARASYDRSESHPSHFQRTLVRLLVQLTIQFPFNCIYQLLALRAGSGTSDSVAKKRKLLPDDTADEADLRAAAASLVIDQSRRVPTLTQPISAIEVLVDAYIELANTAPVTNSSSVVDFPAGLKIKKLLYPLPNDSPLRQVPIPTGPVDGDSFAGFIDGYKLLGGINLPKCIEAVSTNGNRHAQLVKGRDDVRQDAVMEQVFLRVNKLLAADDETRRRGLSLRTYRVIPLRPLVGLIEWVSDSIPFATFLTGAHERLRPGDLTPSKCRELLKAEAERPGSTIQSKLNVLVKEIGQRFRPVLRYFFFEHFSVKAWWAAKQAYTRSMAAASIVGWIVGLGDRHGMNILLDKRTGEIVHIDLNMIFEAGRTLRVPERVPFRMTPDCVDGLGPEGIGLDGPFKNHAVATLKVLRRERALILLILDVFKYDPLQKWTGLAKVIENNTKSIKLANDDSIPVTNTTTSASSSNDLIAKEADRALMRIKEKLEGREEGVVLSEAGHVAYLIQTATDPELLCQMYVGWQAYF